MSEKNFDIYLSFDYLELNIAAIDKSNGKIQYHKKKTYNSFFDNNLELNYERLGILVEESILDIEKLSDQFIKDIFLMVQTPESISIKISVLKKNDGKKILKKDITYLIQDAKQQILNSNSELSIIHIIAENYKLNYNNCEFLPLDVNCENFSIDIEFICFPKILLGKFEKLFFNHQISINQFICTNYAKRFHFKNEAQNICELGKDIVSGINKQEVVSVPKILEKKGLFEKLFHFFE